MTKMFNDQTQTEAWERQNGICGLCGKSLEEDVFHAHHIAKNYQNKENCILLHIDCHYQAHNNGRYRDEVRVAFPYYNG